MLAALADGIAIPPIGNTPFSKITSKAAIRHSLRFI
jgi:hypothetical protein